MDKQKTKLFVLITDDGIESVTVTTLDPENRQAGYNTVAALEGCFAEINKIVRGMSKQTNELRQ